MGRGHHDTRIGLIITGREAQGRNRHQSVVDANLDSIGCQYAGCCLREHVAVDTAVVADGYQLLAALGLYPVGQTLGGLTNHIDIHTVRSCSQHAAQACSTELQGHCEAILNLIVLTLDTLQFLCQSRILQFCVHPTLIIVQIHNLYLTHTVF